MNKIAFMVALLLFFKTPRDLKPLPKDLYISIINISDMVDEKEVGVQKESVKLFKNSKGYTWELKLLPTNGDRLDELDMHRLKAYQERMEKDYGEKK